MSDSEAHDGAYASRGTPKEPSPAPEAEAGKPEDSGASFIQVDTNAIVSDPTTRYFLIKSFSHDNIGRSLQHSVWATSQRNERVLAAAYQTAAFVVLMFSVNHSSRFSGFGVMTSAPGASNKEGRRVFCGPDGTSFPGKLFGVHWVTNCEVFFRDCEHILNAFNENKPVKVGRDGQEIHPDAGRQLCLLIDARQPAQSRPAPLCIQSLPLEPCGAHHRAGFGTPSQKASEHLAETDSVPTRHTASSAPVAPSSELAQQLAAVAKFLKKQQPSEENSGGPENLTPSDTSQDSLAASVATNKSQPNSAAPQSSDDTDAGLPLKDFPSTAASPNGSFPVTFAWDFSWLERHCEGHPVYGIFPVDLTEMSSHEDYLAHYARSQHLWQTVHNALPPGTTLPPFSAAVRQRLKVLRERSQSGPAGVLAFHPTESSSYMPSPSPPYPCGENEAFSSWTTGPWRYSPYGGPPQPSSLGCTPALHPPLLPDCSTSEACDPRGGRGHAPVHSGTYLQGALPLVDTFSKKSAPPFVGDPGFSQGPPHARSPATGPPSLSRSPYDAADSPQTNVAMGHSHFFGAGPGASPSFDTDLSMGHPLPDVQSGAYRYVTQDQQRILDPGVLASWDPHYVTSSSSSSLRASRTCLSRPRNDGSADALEAAISPSRSPHETRPQLERGGSFSRTLNGDDIRDSSDNRRRRARARDWEERDTDPATAGSDNMSGNTISTTHANRGGGRRKVLRVVGKDGSHVKHGLNVPLSTRYQEETVSEGWEWWKHVGTSHKQSRKNAQLYYDPQSHRNPLKSSNSGQPKKTSTAIPSDSYAAGSRRRQPGSRSSPHVQHPPPQYNMKVRQPLNGSNHPLTTQYSY